MKCPECGADAGLVDIIEGGIFLEQRIMCEACGLDEHDICWECREGQDPCPAVTRGEVKA